MRNNPKSLNTFPSALPSSGFNFTSNFSPSSPQCRGMENGCCGHVITCLCCSLSSVGGLLTLLPCSSVASLPWQSPLPWGAVLQELTAPVWVTCRFTSPASKAAPLWAPLSTCPQVLPGAHSSTSFPWGLSLLWASYCCRVSQGHNCLTTVHIMGCRGTSAPIHIRCSNCPTFSNRWLGDSSASWNTHFESPSVLITKQIGIALYHWCCSLHNQPIKTEPTCWRDTWDKNMSMDYSWVCFLLLLLLRSLLTPALLLVLLFVSSWCRNQKY